MSIIAVTPRVVTDNATGERRDALDQRWSKFLLACGLVPVIVPNCVDCARRLLTLLPLRGVLLTGGNDLSSYGGDAPERDEVEEFLMREAMNGRYPLLGVCRGMQLVQHFLGVALQRVEGHIASHQRILVEGITQEVNSFHRFGATATVPDLKIRAIAADGVIEAVRHCQRRVAGVMWHPEREDPFAERDLVYVRRFFANEREDE